MNGKYDPHTNIMQYPSVMQPSHARWEAVLDTATEIDNGVNGVVLPQKSINEQDADDSFDMDQSPSIFTPLKPIYTRNFLIVDTVYENPTSSHLGIPGPDGDIHDLGFNGISSIPDDIRNELPADCRSAFDKALVRELEWKSRWSTEDRDSKRKAPIIDKGLIM